MQLIFWGNKDQPCKTIQFQSLTGVIQVPRGVPTELTWGNHRSTSGSVRVSGTCGQHQSLFLDYHLGYHWLIMTSSQRPVLVCGTNWARALSLDFFDPELSSQNLDQARK